MHNHAFITGASSGIGSALACLLSSKKLRLTLTGRDEVSLHSVYEESQLLGASSVDYFTADLSKREDLDKACQYIKKEVPDLVINSAGIGFYGNTVDIDLELQQNMIDLNVKALFELSVTAAHSLLQAGKKGVILNLSSAASIAPFPGFAVYSASKSFVNQLSISMDYEFRDSGVRVLTACPGVVVSQFRERAGGLPVTERTPGVMTAEYAAEQIWKQIQKKKQINFFSLRYKFLTWLTRYILPRGLVAGTLKQTMKSLKEEKA